MCKIVDWIIAIAIVSVILIMFLTKTCKLQCGNNASNTQDSYNPIFDPAGSDIPYGMGYIPDPDSSGGYNSIASICSDLCDYLVDQGDINDASQCPNDEAYTACLAYGKKCRQDATQMEVLQLMESGKSRADILKALKSDSCVSMMQDSEIGEQF